MKTKTIALLGLFLCALAFCLAPSVGYADTVPTPDPVTAETPASPDAEAPNDSKAEEIDSLVQLLPESVRGFIEPYIAKVPGVVFSILSIYGTLSLAWQALIAWWHKRIAQTTSPDDNAWTDKLSKAWWFRVIDRLFYFGGYIGSALGGKKL